jgi:hypothetical protein
MLSRLRAVVRLLFIRIVAALPADPAVVPVVHAVAVPPAAVPVMVKN